MDRVSNSVVKTVSGRVYILVGKMKLDFASGNELAYVIMQIINYNVCNLFYLSFYVQDFPSGFCRTLSMDSLQTGKRFMRSLSQNQESKNSYFIYTYKYTIVCWRC